MFLGLLTTTTTNDTHSAQLDAYDSLASIGAAAATSLEAVAARAGAGARVSTMAQRVEVRPLPLASFTCGCGGTMKVLAALHAHALLITPPDVVTDSSIPLWCALLLSFAKNPMRQRRLLLAYGAHARSRRGICQRHVVAVFVEPLTDAECALQKEYHVRNLNFEYNRTCILKTYRKHLHMSGVADHASPEDNEMVRATAHMISLFDGIGDAPPLLVDRPVTMDDFMTFGRSVLSTLGSMCGVGDYSSKQLTRSIISRFEPRCANLTVHQLCALYPDRTNSMVAFANHFGDESVSVQELANKATALHPQPDGSTWELSGFKLCCYFCQLRKIPPLHATVLNLNKLRQVAHAHSRNHAGIDLSPSQYLRILAHTDALHLA